MCGVAGWFDLASGAPAPDAARRRAALELLRPRGPDGEGAWTAADGAAGLLHRRLAIVDFAGGAQPMAGPDGRGRLAWNGELFEAAARRDELRRGGAVLATRSDTEVLAHLLARGPEAGLAALSREPGQWALAWVDEHAGTLLLARDPAGEKPLYWAQAGGRVAFASTLDALRALVPLDTALDPHALSLYLSWGFVPAPHTIFAGARKLRAGEALLFARGAAAPRVLSCAPPAAALPQLDAREAPARLGDALRAAARRRLLHADRPVGVFLSGGLDSLAVVTALRDAPTLRSFTVRAADARFDESADAARTARALGVAHTVIEPPAADPDALRTVLLRHGEPFGSASALAVDAVARAAAAHVQVALTGDGGDEALGGYPRHVLLRRLARLPALPAWAAPREGARLRRARRAARLLALDPADRCAALYEVFGDVRAELVPGDDGAAARALVRAAWGASRADDLAAMLRVDRALELPDSHCVKVDVACMAHGVEPRAPWLDREVLGVADALPPRLRIDGARTKPALRAWLAAELPAAAHAALARPKRGFTAGVDAALASPQAEELLLGGALARVPAVRPAPAARLLAEHRAGRGNHRFRLAVLLGLAVFAEAHL